MISLVKIKEIKQLINLLTAICVVLSLAYINIPLREAEFQPGFWFVNQYWNYITQKTTSFFICITFFYANYINNKLFNKIDKMIA